MSPSPELAAALGRQAGLVARRQLSGTDLRLVRRELASGRWRQLGPRVVAIHNGPLTAQQRLWAAVLHAGPQAVLSGRTAASLGGLSGWSKGPIHVLLPRGAVPPGRLPDVTVHWTREPIERHPALEPARVRMPVAVLQTAAWSPDVRSACAVLAAATQQRLLRAVDLRRQLLCMPRIRNRGILIRVLADLEGGAQALGEIDAVRLCRSAGLPLPTRQAVRVDRHGRRRYLDLEWRPWRLAAEIDGLQHLEVLVWCDDLLRQNELVIARTNVLRFPSLVVHTQPERFVDQVRRALLAQGWRP